MLEIESDEEEEEVVAEEPVDPRAVLDTLFDTSTEVSSVTTPTYVGTGTVLTLPDAKVKNISQVSLQSQFF